MRTIPRKAIKIHSKVVMRSYNIISDVVETAVARGYNRSFKNVESPGELDITCAIYEAVMNDLCEILNFGE